jgi:hypothetical protein
MKTDISNPEEHVLKILGDRLGFQRSEPAVRLLRALHQNPDGLAWEDLARKAFDKKGNVKNESPAFRNLLYRVRGWLQDAYSDPSSPLQQYPRAEICVTGRYYSLRFVAEARPHLKAFWRPYLVCEDNARQLQTSDRFFLRLGDHFYFRDIRSPGWPDLADFLEPICNSLDLPAGPFPKAALAGLQNDAIYALAAQVAKFLSDSGSWEGAANVPNLSAEQILPILKSKFNPEVSRHYVSAGESVALTHIAELFQSFNKPVIFGNRVGIATDNELANIVQVGKPRERGDLSEILGSRRFRVTSDRIEENTNKGRPPLEDHLRTHADEISTDAGSGRFKYALVTRCPHRRQPQIITSIVASHGRVTEAVARYLTSETSLAKIFKELEWSAGNAIPLTFQFVLKAEVSYGRDSDRTTATILGTEPGWYNTD